MKCGLISLIILSCFVVSSVSAVAGRSYYVDSNAGSDANDGGSPQAAWASLEKVSAGSYKAGESILLKRDSAFKGKLLLKGAKGANSTPIIIDAYGDGKLPPKIDGSGYIAGVAIEACSYVTLRNLDITSDGGEAVDELAHTDRYGVHVVNSDHVSVEKMRIHDIYAAIQTKSEGKDGTTAYGHGVRIEESQDVRVAECSIEKVGRYGINALKSGNIEIADNKTDNTGCSGLQMGRCKDAIVRGNVFDHPGSFVDERMHGRGSGSWVWTCENVLYEKNRFLNAKGKGDSAGVHIDFNCRNVVIQHCFSFNNEGGFIEILGNNYNCAYRYNISVNDGSRTKGKDGAHQEGKVFWLSGYCGGGKPRSGPFNSYIYNNTIYVKEDAPARFSVSPSTRGALVANNIFHLLGKTSAVEGDQTKYKKGGEGGAKGVVFSNNVYVNDAVLPARLNIKDGRPLTGDAGFRNPGGSSPEDYIPGNVKLIKDMGQKITKLPDDEIGLTIGLDVKTDFFGNPINGAPDIGAVEFTD